MEQVDGYDYRADIWSIGKYIYLNIVMVGFFTAVTKLVSEDSAKKSVQSLVPPHTIENNMKAFDLGYAYGKEHYA